MTRRHSSSRRWLVSPVVSASAAVHAGAAAAVLLHPPAWPWALGALAANHGALTAAGLWPRSRLLGPNLTRLSAASGARCEVAITIDDGPDPLVTPRVLEQLAEHRARATFFCVGERVERYAEIAREIVRQGHCIENHSHRHRHTFSLLGPAAMHGEIARAQDGIARTTGRRPQFFRAPAGLRNPFLQPILEELDLRLASWTRRGFDTVNGDAETIHRRLAAGLRGGDILLLHDGHSARSPQGEPVVLEVLPRLLETCRGRNLKTVTLPSAFA